MDLRDSRDAALAFAFISGVAGGAVLFLGQSGEWPGACLGGVIALLAAGISWSQWRRGNAVTDLWEATCVLSEQERPHGWIEGVES